MQIRLCSGKHPSFGVEEQHSVTGIILLFAGCSVQWESKKQSLVALSTAEVELTDYGRGASGSLSEGAAGALRGGWRTRHLRIRANCLAEAIREGEFTLVGTRLRADALTKCLVVAALERFCEGVGLKSVPKVLEHDDVEEQKEAMIKCLLAVVASFSTSQADEGCGPTGVDWRSGGAGPEGQ